MSLSRADLAKKLLINVNLLSEEETFRDYLARVAELPVTDGLAISLLFTLMEKSSVSRSTISGILPFITEFFSKNGVETLVHLASVSVIDGVYVVVPTLEGGKLFNMSSMVETDPTKVPPFLILTIWSLTACQALSKQVVQSAETA